MLGKRSAIEQMLERQEYDSPQEEEVLVASVLSPSCACLHHVVSGQMVLAFPGPVFPSARLLLPTLLVVNLVTHSSSYTWDPASSLGEGDK